MPFNESEHDDHTSIHMVDSADGQKFSLSNSEERTRLDLHWCIEVEDQSASNSVRGWSYWPRTGNAMPDKEFDLHQGCDCGQQFIWQLSQIKGEQKTMPDSGVYLNCSGLQLKFDSKSGHLTEWMANSGSR
jgi:hypothetical protein